MVVELEEYNVKLVLLFDLDLCFQAILEIKMCVCVQCSDRSWRSFIIRSIVTCDICGLIGE